jgi:hypothetical protein
VTHSETTLSIDSLSALALGIKSFTFVSSI